MGAGFCSVCNDHQPLYGKNWVVEHTNEATQERCLGSRKTAKKPVFEPTPEMKAQEEKKKASRIASGRTARRAARTPVRARLTIDKRNGVPPAAREIRG